MIKTMMILEQMNVHYEDLLGTQVHDETMGARGQASFETRMGCAGKAPVGQWVFSWVQGSIQVVLARACLKYPNLWITEVMGAPTPPIKYSAIRVGPTCACLDMLCFGVCKDHKCTYKHLTARITIDLT